MAALGPMPAGEISGNSADGQAKNRNRDWRDHERQPVYWAKELKWIPHLLNLRVPDGRQNVGQWR
jgi:hypothetical protein